jgi:hypothetical protein
MQHSTLSVSIRSRFCHAEGVAFHDKIVTVTTCGRISFNRERINLSTVFAGQRVGIKQVSDLIWLVPFMDYDLGYFAHETCRLKLSKTPLGGKCYPCLRNKTKPMCPERTRDVGPEVVDLVAWRIGGPRTPPRGQDASQRRQAVPAWRDGGREGRKLCCLFSECDEGRGLLLRHRRQARDRPLRIAGANR